jgi:hypothetical protein
MITYDSWHAPGRDLKTIWGDCPTNIIQQQMITSSKGPFVTFTKPKGSTMGVSKNGGVVANYFCYMVHGKK